MTRVRVGSFTISLDGYGAGPHQDINNPLGIGDGFAPVVIANPHAPAGLVREGRRHDRG